MKTSESIITIMPDLVQAIAEITTIKKDAINPFSKTNIPALILSLKLPSQY